MRHHSDWFVHAIIAGAVLVLSTAGGAFAQQRGAGNNSPVVPRFAPGEQGSRNVRLMSHVPLGRMFTVGDIEVEQELSRPYVYVSRLSALPHETGFTIINMKDPTRAKAIYEWRIENRQLMRAYGALRGAYFKTRGRYYYAQSVQIYPGSPSTELGAIVFDVTGLPDTSKVKEVGRITDTEHRGGFHNLYAYKHSDGRTLLFTTSTASFAGIYDMDKFLAGGAPSQGRIAQIPIPNAQAPDIPSATSRSMNVKGTYHDFYIGYDPATRQDKFYGAAWSEGNFIYDVTRPEEPKLITSITGTAGAGSFHTFTPTPDGRYAVSEQEYQYAPLRIYDLKPGLDGTVKTISRPIGAWTADWRNLAHNHEVRWPYVFVSAYKDGLQIFNMMDPTNPYTVGYYYTYDGPNDIAFGGPDNPEGGNGNANGVFGVDVRNADGMIVVSDMYTGFWSFKMDGFDGWNGHQWGMPNISSAQDWDNGPDGATSRRVS